MEKENLHAGHRDRLRKRATETGLNSFNEHQVLELLLSYILPRVDTNPIAHRLIKEFGSLSAVLDAKQEDLAKVNGIGERAAVFIHLMPQYLKAYKKSKMSIGHVITNPTHVFNYLGEVIAYMPEEEFYMLCLDAKSKVLTAKLISKGTNNQVSFDLKEVTREALKTNACGVILVHNHPSGSNEPSASDIELTKKIYLALSLNGVSVMDHLIISKDDYYSFNKNGLFKIFDNQFGNMFNVNALRQNAPKYEV